MVLSVSPKSHTLCDCRVKGVPHDQTKGPLGSRSRASACTGNRVFWWQLDHFRWRRQHLPTLDNKVESGSNLNFADQVDDSTAANHAALYTTGDF